MMITTPHETPRDIRKKLKRASDSLADWKDKFRDKQYEQKKLKLCLEAARSNRDQWKERCLLAESQAQEMRQQIQTLETLNSQSERAIASLVEEKKSPDNS